MPQHKYIQTQTCTRVPYILRTTEALPTPQMTYIFVISGPRTPNPRAGLLGHHPLGENRTQLGPEDIITRGDVLPPLLDRSAGMINCTLSSAYIRGQQTNWNISSSIIKSLGTL